MNYEFVRAEVVAKASDELVIKELEGVTPDEPINAREIIELHTEDNEESSEEDEV